MRAETLGKVMTMFALTYERPFSQEQAQIWNAVLADVDDGVAIAAAQRVIRSVSFPPKPADIVHAVEEIRQERLVPKYAPPALNEPMREEIAQLYRKEIRRVLGLNMENPVG